MRYLCLVYLEPEKHDAMSESEFQTCVDESLDYDDALRKSGHFLASDALQPIQTATTIRIRDGKIFTTDGPFAETKEHLGGFYLIEAGDLNEAIRLASEIPPVRLGCIEVRPIMERKRS
ncbi:MAG TPA: YciI family protein [Thermoanaerobaculia bacterium]|nr:YciI family protein [Thermoanaerobaculia bacterium]